MKKYTHYNTSVILSDRRQKHILFLTHLIVFIGRLNHFLHVYLNATNSWDSASVMVNDTPIQTNTATFNLTTVHLTETC
jgi:hypothetical protein